MTNRSDYVYRYVNKNHVGMLFDKKCDYKNRLAFITVIRLFLEQSELWNRFPSAANPLLIYVYPYDLETSGSYGSAGIASGFNYAALHYTGCHSFDCKTLFHELAHVNQQTDGRYKLTNNGRFILWHGYAYSIKSLGLWKKSLKSYNRLPWERDANDFADKMYNLHQKELDDIKNMSHIDAKLEVIGKDNNDETD